MEKQINELLAGQKVQTEQLMHLRSDVTELKEDCKTIGALVRNHEVRLTVLEKFCQEQVKPALEALINVRLELARWGAFGGAAGGVAVVLYGLGKLIGWW
jgi:hypothetical protein